MKTIEEVLAHPPVFCGGIWTDKFGVIADFDDIFITKEDYEAAACPYPNEAAWKEQKDAMAGALKRWEPIHILFAFYEYGDYSGDAFVLFEQDGKLFEASGGHCSCFGLEGQFSPEETTLDALRFRLENGTFGAYSGFRAPLMSFLGLSEKVQA